MSRPKTFSDLPEAARRGSEIASFNLQGLPPTAAMFTAVAAFLKSAEALNLSVNNERYNSMRIFAAPTAEEQMDALTSAQDTWDSRRREYDAVLAVGVEPTGEYERNKLVRWAAENGIPAPWTAEAQEDADGKIAALLARNA